MTRIPTATSAVVMTVVALATRAPGVMTRISAPAAKATVVSALPAATVARGLPLMPTAGRGATGLAPVLVATPVIRALLVGMHMAATVVPVDIRQA